MVSKTGAGMYGGSCVGIDSSKLVVGSLYCMIASNSSMESRSNHSNSLMESNSQDSSLIDLKLGRLADCKDVHDNRFLKERFLLSKEKKTDLRVRDREQGERRLGMLKFRVRRKYVIYTCFRGRGRLCEL